MARRREHQRSWAAHVIKPATFVWVHAPDPDGVDTPRAFTDRASAAYATAPLAAGVSECFRPQVSEAPLTVGQALAHQQAELAGAVAVLSHRAIGHGGNLRD